MELVSGIIVYIMLWWIVFYMALPFGVKQHTSSVQGLQEGAPEKPYLLIKIIATTLIAAIAWMVVDYLILIKIIDFRAE
jgi:Predicted secreted protein